MDNVQNFHSFIIYKMEEYSLKAASKAFAINSLVLTKGETWDGNECNDPEG
jgi:hypothetical protein